MIRNFRDLSIYQNKNGKRLKKDLFLRSAALVDLKKKDIARLEQYSKLTVIDLRTDNECREKPDYVAGEYYHISLLENLPSGIAHDKKSKEEIVSRIPNMPKLYAGLVSSETGVKGLAEAFSIICDPDREGAVLWHCTEGKDRCGVLSALFLKLMDFDDEIILADYMKSGKSSRKRGLKYYWIIRILLKNKQGAEAMRTAFSTRKEFLDSAYSEIERIYGGFGDFFRAIGITEEIQQRMKDRFLE